MPTVVAARTDWASKSQRSFLCNVPCQRTEARKCVHNINHIFYQNFMMFLGGYTAFVFYICWGQECVSMGARVCQSKGQHTILYHVSKGEDMFMYVCT